MAGHGPISLVAQLVIKAATNLSSTANNQNLQQALYDKVFQTI